MDVIVWMDYGSVPSTPAPSPQQLEMLFADVDLAIDQGTKMEREECIKEFRDSNDSSLPFGIHTDSHIAPICEMSNAHFFACC